MPPSIWDPACGGGVLIGQFQAAGCRVVGSDIEDRGAPRATQADFESFSKMPKNIDTVVSNPPFSFVEEWVRHGFGIGAKRIIFLARLALLEGQKRRENFWVSHPPARVWICSRRPSIPPGGQNIKAKGGSIPFAWFDWGAGFVGHPEIRWVP